MPIFALGLVLSACTTSGATAASSWPGLTVSDGVSYIAYSSHVYAVDIKNGGLIWMYPADDSSKLQYYAEPEVNSDLVLVGDYTQSLWAIDKNSGIEKWRFADADDRYIGSVLDVNGMVYAPNTDQYLYALDENGNFKWRFKAEGPNWTKPLHDDNYVYMISMDHNLYALNFDYAVDNLALDKGGSRTLVAEPAWSLDLGAAVVADPVIADGVLYTGTVDGTLFAVDLAKQAVLWKFDNGNMVASLWSSPVVLDDAVIFADHDGNVYAVSKADGKALWPTPFNAGEAIVQGSTVVDDKACFSTVGGKVFTIDINQTPKTLATVDAVLYSRLASDDGKIILAPAIKTELVRAIDLNGNEIWKYIPAD